MNDIVASDTPICSANLLGSTIYKKVTPKGITEKSSGSALDAHIKGLITLKYIVVSELKGRIFSKSLGLLWLFLETIISASLYYVLTKVVFGSSMGGNQFLFIFTSVVFWRWFSKSVDSSPNVFVSSSSILKHTSFPATYCIYSFLAVELALFGVSMIVLQVFLAANGVIPGLAYVQLPVLIFAQFTLILFLSTLFATVGIIFKDLGAILYAFTSFLWYLSPGIYSIDRVPQEYLSLYKLNPFCSLFIGYRSIILEGKMVDLAPFFLIIVASLSGFAAALKLTHVVKYRFYTYL